MTYGVLENKKRKDPDVKSMKISHRTLLTLLVFLALFVFFFAFLLSEVTVLKCSIFVVLGFVTILIFSLYCLIRESIRKLFSLAQVYWIFSLIFFGLAPLLMYLSGYIPWGYRISDFTYLVACLLVMVWNVLFYLAYCFFDPFKTYRQNKESRLQKEKEHFPNKSFLFGLFLVATVALAILIGLVGLGNLFSRSTYDFENMPLSLSLIADKVLRGIIFLNAAFQIYAFRNRRGIAPILFISILILLVGCFPLGMARYTMAAIYLGLLMIAFPRFFSKGVFPIVLLMGLVLIFPSSNTFRTTEFSFDALVVSFEESVSALASGFFSPDFDAFSMLCRGIEYVDSAGISYGLNFFGALFFFVPRSLWQDKPFGTGQTISTYQGQAYTNLSCPLPAEFYVAFGLVGVILGAIIIGKICRYIDEKYSELLFYPFLVILFFFMCRGDLMSSFAYLIAYFFVYFVMHKINQISDQRLALMPKKRNTSFGKNYQTKSKYN